MAQLTSMEPEPIDALGRGVRDLRISVTDRCNHRCRYCMPREHFGPNYQYLPRSEILSFEEIARIARIFVALGVRKLRLTGGEPLLRKDLHKLIELLRTLGDIDIAVTTNGSLLSEQAERLAEAGLDRITVSLDSLDDSVYRAMNDVDFPVSQVLEGIETAARLDLGPIKLNAVVRRGVNDKSLLDLVEYAKDRGYILRFIEFMDVGETNAWRLNEVIPSYELMEQVAARFPLQAEPPAYPGEVARRYRYLDGSGELGFISSVSQPFCGDCSRARLSANGKLYTCLFATAGVDLRSLLRSTADDETVRRRIVATWQRRTDRYSELRAVKQPRTRPVEMSYIGG